MVAVTDSAGLFLASYTTRYMPTLLGTILNVLFRCIGRRILFIKINGNLAATWPCHGGNLQVATAISPSHHGQEKCREREPNCRTVERKRTTEARSGTSTVAHCTHQELSSIGRKPQVVGPTHSHYSCCHPDSCRGGLQGASIHPERPRESQHPRYTAIPSPATTCMKKNSLCRHHRIKKKVGAV